MKTSTLETLSSTERIALYYREGASDKVYHVSLEPKDGLFVVNFAFGRRGATLNTGTKTPSPLDHAAARRVFDKLVREKKAKGYTEAPEGTPYRHAEQTVSGLLPQLLNPIVEEEALRLLRDDAWCLQEKKDGRRLLLRKEGDRVEGVNRQGLVVGLPESLIAAAQGIPGEFILDGEAVGEVYHAFDLLRLDGQPFGSHGYAERLAALRQRLESTVPGRIELLLTAMRSLEKQMLWNRLREQKREGVVFKRLDAPYVPGRPSSGGPQLKYKFVATLSARVAALNPRRSVELQVCDEHGAWVSCGNVTIPANQPVPPVGAVVEVRFLYAIRQSGCLYQPVFLGVRDDLPTHVCSTAQLKFKPADEEDEA